MSRRAWLLLALMAVLWGIPYFLIRVALTGFGPFQVVEGRIVLGALVLVPLAWRAGALREWRRLILPTVVIAGLEAALPFALISFGETLIPSSLTGLLIASVPLLVALLAVAGVDRAERPGPRRLAGMLIGFAGVAALLGLDLGRGPLLLGAGLILGASLSYALAAMLIRRWFTGTHPLLAPATTVAIGAVVMAPPALASGWPHPNGLAVLAMVGLGLACTAAGFVGFFALIAEAGAGRATIVTYLNPLIAVALGAAVLHERLTVWTLAGSVLILGGSALANLSFGPREAVQTSPVVPDAVRSG